MEPRNDPVRLTRPTEKRWRISVAAIMALSFGALVLISVGTVLTLTVGANYRNTFDLLGSRATLLIDAMEDALRSHMGSAEKAVDGLGQLYADGGFDIDDDGAMNSALTGVLAAVPEADGMLIYTPDMRFRGVARTAREDHPGFKIDQLPPGPIEEQQTRALIIERMSQQGRMWGAFASNKWGLFANVSVPLERDGVVAGWIIAPIELQTLSRITLDLSARLDTHAFILDGEDHILAQERLADPKARELGIVPLMPLDTFGDPVLARYGSRTSLTGFEQDRVADFDVSEIETDETPSFWSSWLGNKTYVAITRKITGYGPKQWTIGAYYAQREIGDEIMRAWISAMAGLGTLVVAIIAAVMLGKRLARPVRAIADQAQRVAGFELDSVVPLPRSRVRELDEQAVAFNAMLTGLRAFSTYIPRSLVAKLVRSGESGATTSRNAIVTVMFTDIAGFTTMSEAMEASAAAALLNEHFALMCQAIDAHGGTVDKFLGDGMMAFFGAPDRLKGHAAAAVRAAAAIREALAADNRDNASKGGPVLRIRVGIHTGPVIVGNIGAADRVNYTIIGDTVNVSQRLQELGKLVAPDAETAIVISGETASRLDERVELTSAGKHRLRGRGEPIEVFVVGDVAYGSGRAGAAYGTGAA